MPTSDPQLPSPEEVRRFHTKADTDGSQQAAHHSLGAGANQASPGNHAHDGGSSKLLLEGVTLSGSRSGGAALVSVINALVTLGALDNTSA
jgi:hypothetical protein